MTADLSKLRKIWKAFGKVLGIVLVGVLWFFPLIIFSVMALVVSSWSLWWLVLAAALGTIQMLLVSVAGGYIAALYVQKEWLVVWNDYSNRWRKSGMLMNQILEGLYNMMDFIYQEQVRKKAAFEVVMKDLGVETDDLKIPEGMKDFCKTAKF